MNQSANQPEPSLTSETYAPEIRSLASAMESMTLVERCTAIAKLADEQYSIGLKNGHMGYIHKSVVEADKEAAVREAKIQGMQSAKSRVLRRTEIPKDAKNPTRDHIVALGEHIADIIQQDIDKLTHPQADEGEGK